MYNLQTKSLIMQIHNLPVRDFSSETTAPFLLLGSFSVLSSKLNVIVDPSSIFFLKIVRNPRSVEQGGNAGFQLFNVMEAVLSETMTQIKKCSFNTRVSLVMFTLETNVDNTNWNRGHIDGISSIDTDDQTLERQAPRLDMDMHLHLSKMESVLRKSWNV